MTETAASQLLHQGKRLENGEYGVAIRCFDADIQIVLPDASWIPDLIPHLPPEWEAATLGELREDAIRYRSILMEASPEDSGEQVSLDRANVLQGLGSNVEYAVAERSAGYVFVHAGVVMIAGQALVFPGVSHAGKSTLVAALVQQGATYFSDEYAVVTSKGMVLPYLRQIALRNDLFYPLGRTDLSAHAPATSDIPHGVPARLIVFSTYNSTQAQWDCSELDRTSALIELCQNTVGFRQRPDMSFAHLNALLAHAATYKAQRGEAEIAAREILALIR